MRLDCKQSRQDSNQHTDLGCWQAVAKLLKLNANTQLSVIEHILFTQRLYVTKTKLTYISCHVFTKLCGTYIKADHI